MNKVGLKVLIGDMTASSLEMSVSSYGKTCYNGASLCRWILNVLFQMQSAAVKMAV